MKNFKKLFALILALALALSLAACGSNSSADNTNTDSDSDAAAASYKVAIVQQLDHASLDEIRLAIEAELDAQAAEKGIEITYAEFNGQNDPTVLAQIGSSSPSPPWPLRPWSPPWRITPSPSSSPPSPILRPQVSPVSTM